MVLGHAVDRGLLLVRRARCPIPATTGPARVSNLDGFRSPAARRSMRDRGEIDPRHRRKLPTAERNLLVHLRGYGSRRLSWLLIQTTLPIPLKEESPMMIKLQKLLQDRAGANLVEYIILVGVIALIAIVAFQLFGQKITDKVNDQAAKVEQIGNS